MANPTWDDTEELVPSWSDTNEVPSQLESGIRGAAQAATLGFADEATAALESLAGSAGIVPDKTYEQAVAESRANYEQAERANPATYLGGQVAGGVATSLALPGAAATMGGRALQAAGLGAVQGYGATNEREKLLQNMAIGAGAGAASSAIGDKILSGAERLKNYLAPKLRKGAESLAEKATGATGKEIQKMKEGTGRYLLDKGIVGFGDTPENIAKNARTSINEAFEPANKALQDANKGVSTYELKQQILDKADELSKNEALVDVANALRKKANDLQAAFDIGPDGSLIEKTRSLTEVENIKKDFGDLISNWVDKSTGRMNKEVYDIYKNQVEKTLGEASQSGLEVFQKAKDVYSYLSPVEDAAINRASQLKQSQVGGLIDATLTVGAVDPVMGAATAASRRFAAPRAASSVAVITDKMSKALQNPALSKYANTIQNAINRGPTAAAATDYLLQQTSEEYRKAMKEE